MRVFDIPRYDVDAFGSAGVAMDFLPPTTGESETRTNVARIRAGGTLGRHPAVLAQAFAVIEGTARSVTDDGPPVTLAAGTLVVWEPGEVHQTWATTDVLAVVVETSGEVDLTRHVERRAD